MQTVDEASDEPLPKAEHDAEIRTDKMLITRSRQSILDAERTIRESQVMLEESVRLLSRVKPRN